MYHSEVAYSLADEPKELFQISGKTHVALYDDIAESSTKLVSFFGNHLSA
jgi:hypothetical protein